ncbi:MAG: ComF family protein [Chitinophagaceae bacterium]|nr:ComF family protein [Chitinophagaceae bacterium]
MNFISEIKESFLHLAFPHVCEGCGSDLLDRQNILCLHCVSSLPQTNFHLHANNPIEKIFWGRIPVSNATAQYYFTKESLIQRLMHQFKYRGNKELGVYLGRLMGLALTKSNRFESVDSLIPLPLFASKEKRRGYNQAAVLCNGMAEVMNLPVLRDIVIRLQHTESQTKKSRVERWQNIEGKFKLVNEEAIAGKHVLLIDDVVTTGATLEACGREILSAKNVQLSIATLCFSST